MAKDKTPGIDGLTSEFYVMFNQSLGPCLWDAIIESHRNGFLYKSVTRGVISLIPKKDKNPLFLKCWRPLTLLCVEHKIVTKMIATRLKLVIESIIGPQQTAYIPGRYIGTNIRKLIDMLIYLERDEIPAILLTLDFEKCFDSVSHEAMEKSLRYFNIGENFISWVMMVYAKFELCVTNNGYRSEFFPQTHGLHQGCGYSGLGYLCVAEILAINLKNNQSVQPIDVNSEKELISQYADDTSLLTAFLQSSIEAIISELETFKHNTGLKVNYEKSKIYKVGAARRSNAKLKLSKRFEWCDNTIDLLGIIIELDRLDDLEEPNYIKMLEKAEQVTRTWQNCQMTLVGKVQIINTLVSSLFIYRMQQMPMLSKSCTSKINRIITDFIWNGRKPKIRTEILMLRVEDGGFNLVNIVNRDKSQKVAWIPRIIDSKDLVFQKLAEYHMNVHVSNELIWECNFCSKDCKDLQCRSRFWKHLLQAWVEYNFHYPEQPKEVINQILWYNSHIKIARRLVFNQEWYDKGVIYIKDICTQGKLMSFQELKYTYGIQCDEMTYNSIISSIPKCWKRMISQTSNDMENASKFGLLQNKNKWTAIVYNCINHSQHGIEDIQRALQIMIKQPISIELAQKACAYVKSMTKISKYRSFQMRLLHNAVLCNDHLYHMQIVETQLCSLCGTEKETPYHILTQCNSMQLVWREIENYLKHQYDISVEFTPQAILSNVVNDNLYHHVNLITLISKQKIYAAKCLRERITTQTIIAEFEFIHQLELQEAIRTVNVKIYNRRWPDKIVKC